MENNKDKQPEDALILAYFKAEQLTAGELAAVEEWLQDESNNVQAMEIVQVWELSGLASPAYVDTGAGLSSVLSRAGLKSGGSQARKSDWLTHAIAASILIVMACCLWFYSRQRDAERIINAATVQPTLTHLPDSSAVILRKGSNIRYLNSAFTQSSHMRMVLLEGEAYFDVESDSLRPFVVRTPDTKIRVVGTKFTVKTTEQEGTHVYVTEGTVEVVQNRDKYIVKEGQQISVSPGINIRAEPLDVNKLYWHSQTFTFNNDSLSYVFTALERELNVVFRFSDPGIGGCKLNATFSRQSLDTILSVIAKTHHLDIKNRNGTFLVSGKGCH
ncbi:MAG TPA: FecR domain-containing protein [Chryseosolibacter sp.]